ncbi:hypothetical protein [Streptomyces sp. CAU 1734]|uniref:hypothetical protein n=1 Tax=Streptomyces sp. CAU 1734 TaxID=3140360 RepID=UPI0032618353
MSMRRGETPGGRAAVTEVARRIRGASVKQPAGAVRVLVTAGTGVPTSGLILGTDG